jgi:miniconductance mechanosensitive channel
MMSLLEDWIELLLTNSGVSAEVAPAVRLLILILSLAVFGGILYLITKKVVIGYVYKLVKESPAKWDDALADQNVLSHLAHIVPAVVVKITAPVLFQDFPGWVPVVVRITDAYLIILGIAIVFAVVRVIEQAVAAMPAFKDKPVSSYFQLLRLILYIATGILILSAIMGRSPLYFLSAFGALSAILLLIFRDTILGLVASVQMSTNDMVRVGDWVEMPKFNADGDVISINLNTVKVQNWDRTITTIPTYYFITDSFKNWRGMVESGGRRIKRSIHINMQSVRFVDPDTREHYKKYYLITEYVTQRQQEIEAHNARHNFDTSILINGRRMTNLGVFRKYIEQYLRNHPRIRQDMALMVRQLAIEDNGVPLEIYCFTNTTAWVEYESIQADIFDHLLAAAAFFDLDIFQQPSGRDIQSAAGALGSRLNDKPGYPGSDESG